MTLNNINLYQSVRLYRERTSTQGLKYEQRAFPPCHKGALVTTTVTRMRAAKSNGFVHFAMADPGEGPGGSAPALFLDQTEARRAKENFFETATLHDFKGT